MVESASLPAVIFGIMNVLGLVLFLFYPERNMMLESIAMIIFGLAIGALICFLGGLMATDIASKKASGAALGVVGVATYDFSVISWFWLSAAILSVVCTLIVWWMVKHTKTQID